MIYHSNINFFELNTIKEKKRRIFSSDISVIAALEVFPQIDHHQFPKNDCHREKKVIQQWKKESETRWGV